ncbi:MAG: hypothetical protein A2270_08185 [Elusimicrobia bacterium RIFOXYA12_FULL_51_18]|nr:MAG: hypothetical protein A2270_08185 [Elusimicrobia bacterium RIFOXYA12_FULL_51_18]OGS30344.1 MAG: hypothetical protein A2218_01635 [Elusimicrobia bacterium RIFOXYA2_FULL_53_38]
MKKALYMLPLFLFAISAVYAADFSKMETLRAADLKAAPEAAFAAPVPAVPVKPVKEEQTPQNLINEFNNAAYQLSNVENGLTWVRMDLRNLESAARRIVQSNTADPFFQMDLRRMSSDMSRRVNDLQRASMDVRNLLSLAQQSRELNDSARNMERSAWNIMNEAWPTLENSAQNLEWIIRSGKPELFGYDAQWTAMDISRNIRDFSSQARNTYYDAQNLVNKTQP